MLYVTELEGHNDLILSSDMLGTTLVTARYGKPAMMLDLFFLMLSRYVSHFDDILL